MGWLSDLMYGGSRGETYEERIARQAAEVLSVSAPQPAPIESDQPSASLDKPVAADVPPQEVDQYTSANGQKIIPTVSIERVESHLSGDMQRVEVWVYVKNHSNFDVELTRVNFWRQHNDPGRFLKPGEGYDIHIYSGETRHDDAEHKLELQYKIVQTGDYFQADHHIEYRYERNDTAEFYIPEDMKLIQPIRDI